ncbi:MAG: ABC transporter substrate-binding protein [Pseudomonadota bacterium]
MFRLLIPLLALVCAACASEAPETNSDRLVSVGGDVTEIVYALGAGDRLVATDSTSVYPAEANSTPKVGYVRRLSAEGVLATKPDLILISGAAGPDEALEQIREVGIDMVEMPTDYSIEGILAKVRLVAEAIGEIEKGEELAAKIEADWERAQTEIGKFDGIPRAFFFTTLRDGIPQAAGVETAANGVIELLGGENLFGNQSGYTPISNEAAVAADPDMIFVMTHEIERGGGLESLTKNPAIQLTNAVTEGRVYPVDSVRIMQFGPRTPEAIAELAQDINESRQTPQSGG